jgi:hypothetical protein
MRRLTGLRLANEELRGDMSSTAWAIVIAAATLVSTGLLLLIEAMSP